MQYLSRQEILDIHDVLENEGSCLPGIRDNSSLLMLSGQTSMQANDKFYPNIYIKAAFYIRAIAGGHIFNDGNKRSGVGVLDVFLIKNDYILKYISKEELVESTIKIARNELSLEEIAKWIQKNSIYSPNTETSSGLSEK